MQVQKHALLIVGAIGFIIGFAIAGGLGLLIGVAMESNGYRPVGPGWITFPILAGLVGSATARYHYLKFLVKRAQGSSRPPEVV
jgi:phosphate/sulfate permease